MNVTGFDGDLEQLPAGGPGAEAMAPSLPDSVEVVVPVHNEADLLPRCLRGLAEACRRARSAGIRSRVTVVLDACSDRSRELVAAAGLASLSIDVHNVGQARAAGFAWALGAGAGAAAVAADRYWLATTDGDSVVPPDWLTGQVAQARAGADLVLGTVTVDDWSGWSAATSGAYAARYGSFPRGTAHPHVHGANLGIRATVYRAIGGFAPLTTGEDRALVAAAAAADARIVRVGELTVRTSARAIGRAPHGFSEHLRLLSERR